MKRSYWWLGPVLAAAGVVSYFLYFARFPALRDFPWVNLPMVLAGTALSALAAWAVLARAATTLRRLAAAVGLLVSLALSCFFVWYIFIETYHLPGTEGVVRVGEKAPFFRLLDQNGLPVALADYRGKKVVLVFYRGYW